MTPLTRLVATEKVLGIGEACPPDVGKAEAGTCDSWSPVSQVVRIMGSAETPIHPTLEIIPPALPRCILTVWCKDCFPFFIKVLARVSLS